MSHNRDLSAAAAQLGFHNSNIGIGTDVPSETITLNHASGASIGLEYGGSEHGTISVNSAAMYARAGSGKHLILGGNATEALRITSAGNIGINDTAPSQKLNVGGNIMLEGSDQYLYFTNVGTGNAGIYIRGRDATSELRSHSTGMFTWEVTGSEKMRLTSDGRMGVGTASPNHKLTLHNSGTGTFDALNITSGLTNANGLQLGIDSSSNVFFWHTANGAIKFATNNVVADAGRQMED